MQAAMSIQDKWLGKLNSENTRKLYSLCLERFCKFSEKTPEQLAVLSNKEASELIENYLLHLKGIAIRKAGKPKEGEISVNSLGYYIAGVKSFFDQFDDLKINWKRIKGSIPKNKIRHSFRSSHLHELRKILSLANRREKVIILLMVSGGLRVGSLADLKFKDISPSYAIVNSNSKAAFVLEQSPTRRGKECMVGNRSPGFQA